MGDITCLAPRSSCLAHSVSKAFKFGRSVAFAAWGAWRHRKSQKIRIAEPSSSQVSHSCARLSLAAGDNGHSPPLQAPAQHFPLSSALWPSQGTQNRSPASQSRAHLGFTCFCCFSQQPDFLGDGQ